jgi:hypothetical protein
MAALGLELRWHEPARPWAGWHSAGQTRPYFVICHPYDGHAQNPGNGQMVAFGAANRGVIRAAYEAALAHGGSSEGAGFNSVSRSFVNAKAKRRQYKRTASEADKVHG